MEKFGYGLIVVDPASTEDPKPILHFVGYWNQPSHRDAQLLREELKNDPFFNLQDKWDTVDIIPASDEIVEEYINFVEECEPIEGAESV